MSDEQNASPMVQQMQELEKRIKELEKYDSEIVYSVFRERLDKLEDAYKADFETAKDIIFAGAQTHASILKLESRTKHLEDLNQKCFDADPIAEIYNKFKDLELEIGDLKDNYRGLFHDTAHMENLVEKNQSHLEKLHEMINLEDRITASDVLNRLTILEDECKSGFVKDTKSFLDLNKRINKLEKDFESKLDLDYQKWVQYFNETHPKKKPHRCPLCDGNGNYRKDYLGNSIGTPICNPCDGKGIVWG